MVNGGLSAEKPQIWIILFKASDCQLYLNYTCLLMDPWCRPPYCFGSSRFVCEETADATRALVFCHSECSDALQRLACGQPLRLGLVKPAG